MLKNVTAQTGQEEQRENNEKSLVVAPTHDIVAPDAMLGLEGLEREDITLPRIKLTQALSDEVSNGNASPGEWLNTLSGQSYRHTAGGVGWCHSRISLACGFTLKHGSRE